MQWLWISLMIIYMISFSMIIKKADYGNQKAINDFTIKQPYWYMHVGVLGIVGFNLIGLIFLLHQREIVSWIIMILISIPYVFIILYARNWKIEFNELGFSFTNIWNVKKDYLYNQVKVVNTGRGLRIYQGKRKIFAVSSLIVNVDKFENLYNRNFKKRK